MLTFVTGTLHYAYSAVYCVDCSGATHILEVHASYNADYVLPQIYTLTVFSGALHLVMSRASLCCLQVSLLLKGASAVST
jgi:hypothetical protein